jgi:hypothetical protein
MGLPGGVSSRAVLRCIQHHTKHCRCPQPSPFVSTRTPRSALRHSPNALGVRSLSLPPKRSSLLSTRRAGSWMKFGQASRNSTRAGLFPTRTSRTGFVRGAASEKARRLACDHRLVAGRRRPSGASPRNESRSLASRRRPTLTEKREMLTLALYSAAWPTRNGAAIVEYASARDLSWGNMRGSWAPCKK